MPTTMALWGPDHPHLDTPTALAAAPHTAVAIDRGRHPKRYAYTDPNEDVAAVVVDGDRRLLVVADGHNGCESSQASVASVLSWAAGGLPAELPGGDAVELAHETNRAVRAAVGAPDCTNVESRTTLVVALVVGDGLWWASMGDSALFVGSGAGVRRFGKDRSRFLGWPMSRLEVRAALQTGHVRLDPAADAVVAVTDGLHEFARGSNARQVVADALALASLAAEPAPAAALAVIDGAGHAGAGDNVAVAVALPATVAGA